MKKVLLLTDFSDYANHAIDFTLQLLRKGFPEEEMEVVLLHAYYYPYMASGYGQVAPTSVPEPVRETEELLRETTERLQKAHPDLSVRTRTEAGTLINALEIVMRDELPDLAALGTRGAGEVNGLVIGSNAAKVAKEADCPVLIIPEGAVYQPPKKIVFATDFEQLDNLNALNPLLSLVHNFDPHFLTLHILSEGETADREIERMNDILYHYFGTLKYAHYFLEDDHPARGIEAFINEHEANLLVLIDREKGFFETLFHKSVIKQLAFYSKIPLLILKQ